MSNGLKKDETSMCDLSEPQARALAALMEGATLTMAAERAGVSRQTLHRWHHEPRFALALDQAKRDQRAEVHGELRSLAFQALKTLRSVLESEQSGIADRIRVAQGILRSLGFDQPESIGTSSAEVPPPGAVPPMRTRELIAAVDKLLGRR
jgi:hypothetical protein